MNEKVKMYEDNVLINFNVVKCSHDFKVKKNGSTCIFPDNTTYPINDMLLGPPILQYIAYAKRMLEIHCKTYQDKYNDNFICVIPTNIYGADNIHKFFL